ncbi:hypothetical protein U1Q18_005238 [Sarracenia purpurea var. burkii]
MGSRTEIKAWDSKEMTERYRWKDFGTEVSVMLCTAVTTMQVNWLLTVKLGSSVEERGSSKADQDSSEERGASGWSHSGVLCGWNFGGGVLMLCGLCSNVGFPSHYLAIWYVFGQCAIMEGCPGGGPTLMVCFELLVCSSPPLLCSGPPLLWFCSVGWWPWSATAWCVVCFCITLVGLNVDGFAGGLARLHYNWSSFGCFKKCVESYLVEQPIFAKAAFDSFAIHLLLLLALVVMGQVILI